MTTKEKTVSTCAVDDFSIKLPIQYVFDPKEDITAYELAQLLPYLLGNAMVNEDGKGLPVRHLRIIK